MGWTQSWMFYIYSLSIKPSLPGCGYHLCPGRNTETDKPIMNERSIWWLINAVSLLFSQSSVESLGNQPTRGYSICPFLFPSCSISRPRYWLLHYHIPRDQSWGGFYSKQVVLVKNRASQSHQWEYGWVFQILHRGDAISKQFQLLRSDHLS